MHRRALLAGLGATLATPAAAFRPAAPALLPEAPLGLAAFRGTIDAGAEGLRPASSRDQSRRLQNLLDDANRRGRPLFLPPGTYRVGGLSLPSRTVVMGFGRTARLVQSRGSHLLSARASEAVLLDGLALEGIGARSGDPLGGLVQLAACPDIRITDCAIRDAGGTGLRLQAGGGHVSDCTITGARGAAALFALDSRNLSIRDNVVSDCADGGILVHRSSAGEDGTTVTGNRIVRIGAASGGTGQWGNGVNVFRAANVKVTDNHVSDCAFSAIRCNGATNATVTGNTAIRSGETALYAEFAFQGALVANNLVDGAAVGVSIANFLDGGRLAVVASNVVRNLRTSGPYPAENAGFGIGISVEADTAVTGNVVEAARWGMALGWGPYLRDVSVTGNVVREAETGIAVSVVEKAGSATIAGNTIRANRAIVGHRWRDAATGDLTRETPPAHLTIEGNRISRP